MFTRSRQTLRGAGDATILRLAAHANCPVIIMGSRSIIPGIIETVVRESSFYDGNRRSSNASFGGFEARFTDPHNGITVQNVSDSLVEHVTCADCRSGGLVTVRARVPVDGAEADPV